MFKMTTDNSEAYLAGEDCAFEAAKEDNILILAIVEKKRGVLFSDELLIALCSIFVPTWNEGSKKEGVRRRSDALFIFCNLLANDMPVNEKK